MADPEAWIVNLKERAQDKRPVVALNVRGPASADIRLDQLCDMLDKASHARPSRDLLVAALILRAPTDVDALESCLMEYRAATHADVLLDVTKRNGKLDLAPLKETVKAKNA